VFKLKTLILKKSKKVVDKKLGDDRMGELSARKQEKFLNKKTR